MDPNKIFEDLFVLELANNHWGNVERGLKIISDYGKIVRFNNVRAAIKLQFRDIDRFIHKNYRTQTDVRYIKKTIATKLPNEAFAILINAIRRNGCIPMATALDEDPLTYALSSESTLLKWPVPT